MTEQTPARKALDDRYLSDISEWALDNEKVIMKALLVLDAVDNPYTPRTLPDNICRDAKFVRGALLLIDHLKTIAKGE